MSVAQNAHMRDAFAVVANPTRRALLEMLACGEQRASDLAAPFPVSRPAIAQHLRVMALAGVVTQRRYGRERYYTARLDPLGDIDQWLLGLTHRCAAELAAS
jgi:predicted transcriptional regulator